MFHYTKESTQLNKLKVNPLLKSEKKFIYFMVIITCAIMEAQKYTLKVLLYKNKVEKTTIKMYSKTLFGFIYKSKFKNVIFTL